MEIIVQQGDITTIEVDAIVNAANTSLLGGGGVDGAIHSAGGPDILAATKELRATSLPDGLPTGDAVATTAGNLPARWVIHTVGPVYSASTTGAANWSVLIGAHWRSLMNGTPPRWRFRLFPLVFMGGPMMMRWQPV